MPEQIKRVPEQQVGKVGIDDIMEAATAGVLRALEARRIGVQNAQIPDLVASGFAVELIIRCGKRPPKDTTTTKPPVLV